MLNNIAKCNFSKKIPNSSNILNVDRWGTWRLIYEGNDFDKYNYF
jgi:hypothetical protein